MKVIAFGGNIGSGKSKAADLAIQILEEHYPDAARSYRIWRGAWAGELKRIAGELGWDGKKDAQGRRLLQQLGAVLREYDEDAWIKLFYKWVHRSCDGIEPVWMVIDDTRHQNEIDASLGCLPSVHFTNNPDHQGWAFLVTGRSGLNEGIENHESEQTNTKERWTCELDNSGSLGHLYDQILGAFIQYGIITQESALFQPEVAETDPYQLNEELPL